VGGGLTSGVLALLRCVVNYTGRVAKGSGA
jgi:hypothetical protein